MRPGPHNRITDVPGLQVGNAQNDAIKTGTTVLRGDVPFTCGVHIMGGAPGTRETALLAPDKTVAQVDALVLSGGSAFGLSAASGVADALRLLGRGFQVADQNVPIVPAAILFDLINGGDKAWDENPYHRLGQQALRDAAPDFAIGSVGAGTGATTATFKGGLGTASCVLPGGIIIGALVAVNALGSATLGDTRHFWAAPWEQGAEFGGYGPGPAAPAGRPVTKGGGQNTTIGIIATNAVLDKAHCTRLATAAHDGFARALVPSHTPMDGDLIFTASTGTVDCVDYTYLGHAAATCMARAIARGIYAATPAPGDLQQCYGARFSD